MGSFIFSLTSSHFLGHDEFKTTEFFKYIYIFLKILFIYCAAGSSLLHLGFL